MNDILDKYPFLEEIPFHGITPEVKVREVIPETLGKLMDRSGCLSTVGGISFIRYYAIYGDKIEPLSACKSRKPLEICSPREPCSIETYTVKEQLDKIGGKSPNYIVEYINDGLNRPSLTIYRITASA